MRNISEEFSISDLDSEEEREQKPALIYNGAVSADKEAPGEAVISPPSTLSEILRPSSTPIVNIEYVPSATGTSVLHLNCRFLSQFLPTVSANSLH